MNEFLKRNGENQTVKIEDPNQVMFKDMYFNICKGDPKIWENTYGTMCPFTP